MRNVLLFLMALFMVNTAMADSYLYLDDVHFRPEERQITVPVKAHFDGRLNVFILDVEYPEGITPVSVENGAGMTLEYFNQNGITQQETVNISANSTKTRFMGVVWTMGYWQPNGSGSYECYGTVKWEAGDYDEMFLITLAIDESFNEGEIHMTSQVTSNEDARGGTATPYGQSETVEQVSYVSVIYPPLTPTPVITYYDDYDCVVVTAEGEGEVHLYIDGEEVENPYTIARQFGVDAEYVATATAQGEGMIQSEYASEIIYVAGIAKMEVPAPEINCEWQDNQMYVTINWPETDGERMLFVNGEQYDASYNSIVFEGDMYETVYHIEAYTTEGDMYLESSHTLFDFVVPGWNYLPEPEIEAVITDDAVIISASGEGEITLYIDGEEVENPCTLQRGDEDYIVNVAATAHASGMFDGNASTTVTVPAKEPAPVPAYSLTMADAETLHGKTIVIPVTMTNPEAVTAFQTDLYLPEGFELLDVVLSNRKVDHQLQRNSRPDGGIRILCFSMNLTPFTGNDGELFYITVKVPDNAAGEYNLMLKKSLLTLATYNEVHCADAANTVNVWAYLMGDANGDGEVTVTDIVVTANYILGRDVETFIPEAADVNGDGDITVTDVVLIARMVLDPGLVVPGRAPALGDNNDSMSADDIQMAAGETRTVAIALDNAIAYTAFQLDLQLPDGLSADNFRLTNRAGSHVLGTNMIDGKQRVMCYSPMLNVIDGNEGALLTFDVTATGNVTGDINVDGIELVSAACQTVYLDAFDIRVNSNGVTAMNEISGNLRIYADGHDIIVESPVSQRVVISDVAGRSYSVDVTAGRNVIPARLSGVVIVAAGEKTVKLMLN